MSNFIYNISKIGKELSLFSKSGLLLATCYDRIVIGGRGPYVEFSEIIKESVHIPEDEYWRINSNIPYYIELRSNCSSYVKVYKQKKTVKYADYIIDKYYISPLCLYFRPNEFEIKPCAMIVDDYNREMLLTFFGVI